MGSSRGRPGGGAGRARVRATASTVERWVWRLVFAMVLVNGCVGAATTATRGGIRAYYINARGAAERRLAMEDGFRAIGTTLERVAATDATRASELVRRFETRTCKRKGWAPSGDDGVEKFSGTYLERLGRTLSHLSAIYEAADAGAETALVLEDDASPELMATWMSGLEEYVSRLPDDWTLVQLSALGESSAIMKLFYDWQRERKTAPGRYLSSLPKGMRRLHGTQAYLISKRGMDRLVKAYRAPVTKEVDVCSLTCVEFDECVLADGVKLDNGFRVATPPLFIPRGRDKGQKQGNTFHEVRDMMYSWAATLSLTKGMSANMFMDGKLIRAVLREGVKVPDKLTPNSFHEHFNYHCKLNHGGGARCAIKRSYLKNQKPPPTFHAKEEDSDVEAGETASSGVESSLGSVAIPRQSLSLDGSSSRRTALLSPALLSVYIFAAVALGMLVATNSARVKNASLEELRSIRSTTIDAQTEEYYS